MPGNLEGIYKYRVVKMIALHMLSLTDKTQIMMNYFAGSSNATKCYGNLGCLHLNDDWFGLNRPVNVLPLGEKSNLIKFDPFGTNLIQSDPQKLTMFIRYLFKIFWIAQHMKPHNYIVKISIFSLYHVIFTPTKLINNLSKDPKILILKVIFQLLKIKISPTFPILFFFEEHQEIQLLLIKFKKKCS